MPTTIFLVANEEAYNELSDADRAALDSLTGLDISQRAAAGLAKFGKIAMGKFAAKDGAQIITLSDEARAAFDERAAAAVAALKAKFDADGIPATQIIADMME